MKTTKNPKGAGRKHAPVNLKKNPVNMKLPQWLIEWTKNRPESRAVLIEDALKQVHNLVTPKAEYDEE